MLRLVLTSLIVLSTAAIVNAGTVAPRAGWSVIDAKLSFPALVERLESAIKGERMELVTAASASDAANAAGFTIPGNRVVGVYRNDFARRMLAASVFALHLDEGKDALKSLASELDAIFARIAVAATT